MITHPQAKASTTRRRRTHAASASTRLHAWTGPSRLQDGPGTAIHVLGSMCAASIGLRR